MHENLNDLSHENERQVHDKILRWSSIQQKEKAF